LLLRWLPPYYGFNRSRAFERLESAVALHASAQRQDLFTVLFCGGSVPEIFGDPRTGGADRLAELLAAELSKR